MDSIENTFDEELERRLDTYYDSKPGSEECPIKPLTIKGLMPAIIVAILLTLYLLYGMIGFSSLYPQ
jgi:hypothetical protein